MKKRLIVFLILTIILTGCENNLPEEEFDEQSIIGEETQVNVTEFTKEDLLREEVEAMKTNEKIGQLIMAGFEGTELGDREIALMTEYNIGGFILFGRNIDDEEGTRNLLDNIKKTNAETNIPLLIGVDEEGGVVTRLSNIYKNLPPQSIIGEKNDLNFAYKYGEKQGEKLKRIGFNVNFSPVLDINSNPENPVIGNRAISDDPEVVANLGVQVFKGLQSQGIIPVGKHYPGHGDTYEDSHTSLPIVNKSKKELNDVELIPFKKAIDENIPAIMVGHLLVPSLDDVATSLSEKTIEGFLREEQGFNGVVFSDDITMGAITENSTVAEGAREFILAGGDIVLVCHGENEPIEVFNYLLKSYNDGILEEQELDKKVTRIIKLKRNFHLEDKPVDRNIENNINEKIEGIHY